MEANPTASLTWSLGPCQPSVMTQAAKQLIESFESLPESDKQSVAVEILRRTTSDGYPALADEELVLAADQVFLDLDRREGSG